MRRLVCVFFNGQRRTGYFIGGVVPPHSIKSVKACARDIKRDFIIVRLSDARAVFLACIFFCIGGQGTALAAETATPLVATTPEPTTDATEQSAEAVIEEDEAVAVGEPPAGSMFVLAPIAWGGDVSQSFRKQSFESGLSSLQNVQAVNLRMSTYFWQPWLAQVNGGLGVVNAKNIYGSRTDESVSLNGRAALSLVPQSNFPFQASYYARDSRSDAGATPAATSLVGRSTGFEVLQRYRPPSKSSDSLASYNRDQSVTQRIGLTGSGDRVNSRLHLQHDYRLPGTRSAFGVGYDRRTFSDAVNAGTVTGLNGSYSTKFNHSQSLDVKALHSGSEYAQDSLRFNNVSVRHSYRSGSSLSVATSAFASQSESFALGLNAANSRNLQLNSATSWQPDEELPFYVSGSVRVFDAVYETPTTSVISQSQTGNVSVNYAATRNLSYTVYETLSNTRSGGSSAMTTLTGGRADYNSDETPFRSAFHRWNANGGLDYQTSSAAASYQTIFAGAGQGLRLPYALDEGAMDFSFNQALSVREGGVLRQTNTLNHNGRVIWRPVSDATQSSTMSFAVSDMLTFGDRSSHLQTADLSVNTLRSVSAYSSATASAALKWTANDRGQSSTSATADVKYNHARVFDVKGLRYTLTLQVNKFQFDDVYGQNADNSRDGYLFDQKLEYAIGRAYLRLNGAVAKSGESKSTLIVLQLGRNFGEI